jgi:hypothetical protein
MRAAWSAGAVTQLVGRAGGELGAMRRRRVPTKEASRPSRPGASGLVHAKARLRTALRPGARKREAARRRATLSRLPKEEWCARETLSAAESFLRSAFPRASLDQDGDHRAGPRKNLDSARASTLARRFHGRNQGGYRFQSLRSPRSVVRFRVESSCAFARSTASPPRPRRLVLRLGLPAEEPARRGSQQLPRRALDRYRGRSATARQVLPRREPRESKSATRS